MPEVMASWLKLTRAPRTRGGSTSPMYSGTTIDAEPAASSGLLQARSAGFPLGGAGRSGSGANSAAISR
jgi:hypothetical protein